MRQGEARIRWTWGPCVCRAVGSAETAPDADVRVGWGALVVVSPVTDSQIDRLIAAARALPPAERLRVCCRCPAGRGPPPPGRRTRRDRLVGRVRNPSMLGLFADEPDLVDESFEVSVRSACESSDASSNGSTSQSVSAPFEVFSFGFTAELTLSSISVFEVQRCSVVAAEVSGTSEGSP